MLLVDDLAASGTKNLHHTPRGLVTLNIGIINLHVGMMTPMEFQFNPTYGLGDDV